jgi:translocation and assembly module TamA
VKQVAWCALLVSVAYGAKINGIRDAEIVELAKSQIINWEGRYEDTPVNRAKIMRDVGAVRKVLGSFGYFDANVTTSLLDGKVIFNVELGMRYKIKDVSLVYTDNESYRFDLSMEQVFSIIGTEGGMYVDFKYITDGRDKLKEYFKTSGFAFADIAQPEIKIDKQAKEIKVIYTISLRGKTIIDSTALRIKSQKDPKLIEPFIRNRIPWKDGDVYNSREIESMIEQLMESGIFATVDVELSQPIQDPSDPRICHTNITINIEEAKLRDIAAGVKYGSSEKIGILLSWAYYNIDGRGSKLSTVADVAKRNRTLKVQYDMYDLFYRRQNLTSKVFYMRNDVDAYTVSMIGAESMLWQTFFDNLKIGAGACYENASTVDKTADGTPKVKFKAAGVPVGIRFDTTDNYLDPSRGLRCSLMVTSYFGKPSNVSILLAKASVYFPLIHSLSRNTLVLSAYSKVGSIFRNKNRTIPRHKFFFAGGNNSVRGYGYQKISELSDDGKPLGGESLFEFGIEPRVRVTDDIGIVAFWEGGNVRQSRAVFKLKDMLFGYGAGVRYYTQLGQIRFDVAFPTKIRKSQTGKRVDSRFNIYISVGQAF